MSANAVFFEAKMAEVSKRTLLRAKRVLHIKPKKMTVKWGRWLWSLPDRQKTEETNDTACKPEGETAVAAVTNKAE